MTKEPRVSNSRDISDMAAAQSARPNLITAKEAAQRLGVSRSTVYRIDREIGPFRFVVDGRWILIDQASFESHIANIRGNRSDVLEVGSVLPSQQAVNEPETLSETDERQLTASEMATPKASTSISTREGQRELLMPEYRHPFAFAITY